MPRKKEVAAGGLGWVGVGWRGGLGRGGGDVRQRMRKVAKDWAGRGMVAGLVDGGGWARRGSVELGGGGLVWSFVTWTARVVCLELDGVRSRREEERERELRAETCAGLMAR